MLPGPGRPASTTAAQQAIRSSVIMRGRIVSMSYSSRSKPLARKTSEGKAWEWQADCRLEKRVVKAQNRPALKSTIKCRTTLFPPYIQFSGCRIMRGAGECGRQQSVGHSFLPGCKPSIFCVLLQACARRSSYTATGTRLAHTTRRTHPCTPDLLGTAPLAASSTRRVPQESNTPRSAHVSHNAPGTPRSGPGLSHSRPSIGSPQLIMGNTERIAQHGL